MLRKFMLLIVLLLPLVSVQAQGAPDQIDFALSALSGVVDRNVTLNDLENWRWAQDLYPDLSLGCPQPDTAYAQIGTQGFKFLLTYEGVIYDYRVSADGNTVILCSQVSQDELMGATATPVDEDALDISVGCADPEPGVVYMPRRLTAAIQARVAEGPPIIQRIEPSDNGALVGEIPGGAVVDVLAGPACADGLVWWQVDYDGQVGWTVEGRDGTYWLGLMPGVALPANLAPLTADNVEQIIEVSRVENNIIPAMALNGTTLAVVGGPGTQGIWLYDLNALATAPSLLRGTAQLTSVAYHPDGTLLLLGDTGGGVRLWSTDQTSSLLERWFDQSHESIVTAVAMSPDGQTAATAGDVAVTGAEIDKNFAVLLWNVAEVSQTAGLGGHTGPVNALVFDATGATLASASDDTTVRLWNTSDGTLQTTLAEHSAPVTAAAYSPDGTLLATASSDGTLMLWDVASQTPTVHEIAGLSVQTLAFSPDGRLLAVAGGDDAAPDYAIRIWDVASGSVIASLTGHTAPVGDLAFNADGTTLISVSEDRSVRFWGAS